VYQPDPPRVRGSTRAVSPGCVRLMLAAARSLAEREGGRAVGAGRILVETVQRDDQIAVPSTRRSIRWRPGRSTWSCAGCPTAAPATCWLTPVPITPRCCAWPSATATIRRARCQRCVTRTAA